MNLIALQVKTSYSILNSLNDIKKLVSRAKEYGYSHLAITDEDNMFGVMEFYHETINNNIKPIIGIELHLKDKKIILYAKNNDGYKNIIKLSTIASSEELSLDILKQYRDNLILVMPFSFYDKDIWNLYKEKFIGFSTLSEKEKIKEPKVFINNIRYLDKDDDIYLDYANMIRDGKIIGEYELHTKKDSHLLKDEEYASYIDEDTQKNMEYIASTCNVTLDYTEGLLPVYDANIDSKKYLQELSQKGLNKRLDKNVPKIYQDRLEKELSIIDKMGFNDYFLIVYDYVLYAKKHNILVGPGRGSAAGSLVSYTLGITDVDPIKYNLLFERFLNPERVTMPDIDIDFDAQNRGEVIDYVIKKYGEKKVVGIITFNTMGAKQVVRDVGRILNLKQSLIDTIARNCTKELRESYKENKNLKKLIDNSSDVKKLYEISLKLEGLPRHVSVHAAGVVMSKYDIDETIPLYKNQLGMYVAGYSKDYLEPLGLLKMDFLGISNLTLIDEVINNIRNDMNLNITFANIPMDDAKTINLFAKGDTEGIFQFEAPGMIKFLKELKAQSFNDIVAATSLYRPGPMDSIPEYLKRRSGKVEVDYISDSLKDILEETYGIIIYQEQVMQIAVIMAGFSMGEADILRRAMSKKKEEILIKEKEKFITGSINNGYDLATATKVYDLILKFANYGFNKSHAVSYAMIAYKMAFLKTHFYSYFMLSLLTNSINNEAKTNIYISKLRGNNIKVLPPDINLSGSNYIIKNKVIICPLSIIHNVGISVTNVILIERENSQYTSFIDFVKRTYKKGINRKVLEFLILSGAFDSFGYNHKTLMVNLDNIINYAELSDDNSLVKLEEPIIDNVKEYSNQELIEQEYNTFGFYLRNHPVTKYKNEKSLSTLNLEENIGKNITLILEINHIKEIVTKRNDVMAFVRTSDEFGQIELVIFPDVYKNNNNLKIRDIIIIDGRVEKKMDNYSVVVSRIKRLED